MLTRTKEHAEQWLESPPEEALQLQNPAPDDAIVLLPQERWLLGKAARRNANRK